MKNPYIYYFGYISDYLDCTTDEMKRETGLLGIGKNGSVKKIIKTDFPGGDDFARGFVISQNKYSIFTGHKNTQLEKNINVNTISKDIESGRIGRISDIGSLFIPFYASDENNARLIFELEILEKLKEDIYEADYE